MPSYQTLINYLKQQQYRFSIKSGYFVVAVNGLDYHITVYQDQWDDYEEVTGNKYHLFHISSEQQLNRCSSYFWVSKQDNRIKKIPPQYFSYNQPSYNFTASTRSPCQLEDIDTLLKIFQQILDNCEN